MRGLQLSFTPWSECGADCGAGYNDRSAICADADALLVDVSACSTYSGVGTAILEHALLLISCLGIVESRLLHMTYSF